MRITLYPATTHLERLSPRLLLQIMRYGILMQLSLFLEVFSVIVALEEARYSLLEQRAKVEELGNALRIDEIRKDAEALEQQTYAEDFKAQRR